jgi:hypothetical protein
LVSLRLDPHHQGTEIETPEERRRTQVSNILKEADEVSYVLIPADSSAPLQELHFLMAPTSKVDGLREHLKPAFAGGRDVDIDLLRESSGAMTLTASSEAKVSDQSLRKVAQEGHVEVFSLVHATPSNNFTGVNFYVDEGMCLRNMICIISLTMIRNSYIQFLPRLAFFQQRAC